MGVSDLADIIFHETFIFQNLVFKLLFTQTEIKIRESENLFKKYRDLRGRITIK